MLKWMLVFCCVVAGPYAQADDWGIAHPEYSKSYLQVDECFEKVPTTQVACVISGIQRCVDDLEFVFKSKGLYPPGGADMSPDEYCNHIGLERADEHLNAVYQRIMEQGSVIPGDKMGPANLRATQRLWIQFANDMCSEENIVGWHAGGSGWGAAMDECTTRLSIQQAGNLDRFFSTSE